MKKILLLIAAAALAVGTMQAKTADELRIYLNPGHGSYGANDRPMNTVSHPDTYNQVESGTTTPDTLGFFEGRGTLPRAFGLGSTLVKMGVKSENIVYSRLTNGPWPTDNGESSTKYNRNLSEICEEVELGNFDMFISCHSNAATDGTATNYPLILYRGHDKGTTGHGYNGNAVEGSYDMAAAVWTTHYMTELDPQTNYSRTSPCIRGDIDFYGSASTSTRSNGNSYTGYLGVLKHGVPGFLNEGYFHTYQPARHRGLNFDYDRQEGRREARGVGNYFGLTPLSTGDIMGSVRDMHEKIQETYYRYAAGTYDQWYPINGAVVTLSKNGNVVATYTCDNDYNGIFVFEDLDPGTYVLSVTKDGYKALGDYTVDGTIGATNELLDSQITLTVKANETVYSKLFIEKEGYVPEKEVYYNYPEPNQPDYLKLADEYTFTGTNTVGFEMEGVVKDMVQLGDSAIFLSNDGLVPHLYLVNSKTQELVRELSVEGLYTEESAGFYSPLNAIALTADHKLVGVNSCRNQSDPTRVDEGYTRGTMRLYIWDDLDSNPREWATSQLAGNYYRGDMGYTLAVNGASDDCAVVTTAVTSSDARTMRFQTLYIVDNQLTSVNFDNANKYDGFTALNFGDPAQGGHMHLALNPIDEKKYVIGGSNGKYFDFTLPTTAAGIPTNVNELSSEFNLKGAFQFFKYAHHCLMIAPYAQDGTVKGIRLLDITNGIDQAKLIKTKNSDLTEGGNNAPRRAPADDANAYNRATATVASADINAYLVNNADLTYFAAKADEQPGVKGIYAYNLSSHGNENTDWTFSFDANDDAEEAFITLYDMESGEEVGTLPLTGVKEGANEFSFASEDLPGEDGQRMNWAVTLKGQNVSTITRLNTEDTNTYTRIGNVSDNSPESDYFGRIYVVNRISSSSAENGVYAYNQDWTRINSTPYTGGRSGGNPFRLATDENGTISHADWANGAMSGVYRIVASNLDGEFTSFFEGTHASNGLISTPDGEPICSSTPSVFVTGTGANTHMYCHLEDYGNQIAQYNIGNEDGSIMTSWDKTATRFWGTEVAGKLISTHAAVINETEDGGIWIVQNRSGGNNNSAVPSIMYVKNDGEIAYNSGTTGNPIHEYLTGTQYAAGAISKDGTELVVNQPDGTLKFFEVSYDGDGVPSLDYKYEYKAGVGSLVTQINYDYAGNLLVSGNKLVILSMPTENNENTTPAKKRLIVRKGRTTGVNAIADADNVKIVVTPNPTTGLVTVKGVEVNDLKVYSINGALVATSNEATVDLGNLAAGMYLIKVNGGEAVRVIKK